MRKRFVIFIVVMVAVLSAIIVPTPAYAGGAACPPESSASGSVVVNARNADITVLSNGDVRFVETWIVDFIGTGFRFAFRTIPLNRAEDIVDWSVSEGGTTYTNQARGDFVYTLSGGFGERTIHWCFPSTSNQTRTFTLSYTVQGSLGIYDEGDRFFWKFIEADRGYTILESNVQVHLPAEVAGGDLTLAGFINGQEFLQIEEAGADSGLLFGQSNARILDADTVEFWGGPYGGGEEWEIGVRFPHGLVSAERPSWQVIEDNSAFFALSVLCVAGIIILASALGLYLFWYLRGRDKPVGVRAEFIPHPPEALPPGVAGVLLDERADMEDITSTLVDLAHRGYLTITELDAPGFGRKADFLYERTEKGTADLLPYEMQLYKAIFSNRKSRKLSNMKNKFYTSLPKIRADMYQDVTQRGYFSRSPEAVRQSYGCGALILTGILGFAAFLTYSFAVTLTSELFALFLGGSLLVFPVGLLIASRYMPRKTDLGARTAAQFEAFKRYLGNIQKYTDVENAREQFEKYLPYAIAFGLEKSWVLNFSRTETPMPLPTWYHPYYPTTTQSGGRRGSARPVPGGGAGAPSLDDAAGRVFGGLESMSTGLFTMLDQAASTFTSAPSSSGSGGGGGGGFSGGGGGGGGSSGFG
jgi:uncharacterized membrane protein